MLYPKGILLVCTYTKIYVTFCVFWVADLLNHANNDMQFMYICVNIIAWRMKLDMSYNNNRKKKNQTIS